MHANKEQVLNLTVYGLSHAIVDATCAALIFSMLALNTLELSYTFFLVVLYNVIAFGSQPLIGLVTDKFKIPKETAITGAIITAIAAFLTAISPLTAVIIAGIGNALFHVGGGTISLNLTPKRATAPGIFVAPGALGLLIGTLIGKSGAFIAWQFAAVIFVFCIFMWFTKQPAIDYDRSKTVSTNYFELIIIFILLTIVARSLVGTVISMPWKSQLDLLIVVTLGVVLGKSLGGMIADRYGWIKVTVTSLLVSAPLLAFGATIPILGIVGIFLFNFTMPITLVAMSNIIPGRPGFAFGLTTLALIMGVLPTYTASRGLFAGNSTIFIIIIISAALLYFGLTLNEKSNSTRNIDKLVKKEVNS